jgi:hypothetical protein
LGQFSVLSVFLFSLLSLAFVLGSDIYIYKNTERVLESGFQVLWQKKDEDSK